MSASYGPFDRTTLNALSPNLDVGDVADPALRLAYFQYLADYGDAMYSGVKADIAGLISAGTLSRLGIINVKDYGASGSANTYTGTIASGSRALTLTTSNHDFVALQGISIPGAGVAGATLVTTVSSVGGANIQLATAASTAATGVTVSHDDTVSIQSAINAATSDIYLPDGTYMINTAASVVLKSNIIIVMSTNAILKAMPSNQDEYYILEAQNLTNIKIIGGKIQGERDSHIGATGERGMGIYLKGCSNVEIIGTYIEDCWGDAIYIGSGTIPYCENVKIIDVTCDNNRRNGISLVSGKNIDIIRPRLINTNGTNPQSGLDVEPNDTNDFIENVRIIDPYSENNENQGIIIGLGNYTNSSKDISIYITNHEDKGSINGIAVTASAAGFGGSIDIVKPKYMNNGLAGIQIRDYESTGPVISIDSPTILNCNVDNNSNPQYGSGIVVYAESGDTRATNIGNVHITNPSIIDTRGTALTQYSIYVRDLGGAASKKVSIINPKNLTTLTFAIYGEAVVKDSEELSTLRSTSDVTVRSQNYQYVYSNSAATALRVFTLNDSIFQNWPEITFVDENTSFRMRIKPESVCNILPLSSTAGKYIQSSSQGCRITLRKIGANSFHVTNIIGTWTVEP